MTRVLVALVAVAGVAALAVWFWAGWRLSKHTAPIAYWRKKDHCFRSYPTTAHEYEHEWVSWAYFIGWLTVILPPFALFYGRPGKLLRHWAPEAVERRRAEEIARLEREVFGGTQ